MINQKLSNLQHKVQEVKSKASSTNLKGPIKQWVPKSEIVNATDMSKSKANAKIMVPRQRLLKTHDRREVQLPQPNNEGRRKCEIWRQPIRISLICCVAPLDGELSLPIGLTMQSNNTCQD